MKTHINGFLTVVLLLTGISISTFQAAAQGLQRVTIHFTLTSDDPLAPSLPISGTIVYTAPSSLDPVLSIDSINMTIADHSYSVAEIGYEFAGNDLFLIGGLIHGVDGIASDFTDDFQLRWNPRFPAPIDFLYVTSKYGGIWPRVEGPGVPYEENFPTFTVTTEPVPEPAMAEILLLGVAFAGLTRLRTNGLSQ